jgi:hypothetical protein
MKPRTNSTNHQRYDYEVTPLSRYSDMIWDLTPLLHDKRSSVYSLGRLNFNLLASKPLLIDPFKHFFYLRLAHVKPVTLANEYASLSGKIIAFMEEENLSSLAQFNTALFMRFNQWLKHHYMTDTKQANNMCRISNTLYKILNMNTDDGFCDLPQQPIRIETSLWDWWGANKQGALERQNGPDDHSIPIGLWKSILQCAWNEPDILQTFQSGKSKGLFRLNHAKFAILIQAHTGLRISEILYLKCGCAHQDQDGTFWLNVTIQKTEREPYAHRIMIPKEIYELLHHLERLTEPLRDEAIEKNYLFYLLSPRKGTTTSQRLVPTPMESGKWNHSYLRVFLKRNNLALTFFNRSNQEVTLTSHCFRHTFAKLAASECDVNLVVLQTHFKHLSIEMTSHYVHRSKEELKQSYLQGMLNAKYLHTQGIEGEIFKHRLHSIQTSLNLSDKIDDLSKVFGINPLPFGMCLYDFKRGHCPNLGVQSCYTIGCKDFVTNETFLPNFMHEATLLERHIEHCNDTQPIEVKKARFRLSKVNSIIESIQPKDNHA